MFGISGFELLIIVAFVLLIFGPEKLPELGRLAGKAAGTFKRAQEEMERVIRAEVYAPGKATPSVDTAAAPGPDPKVAEQTAGAIWSATDEDEEEDEE